MTNSLGQLELFVEPKWVIAPYRAGIGYDELWMASKMVKFVRVELLESATLSAR